MIVLRTTPWTKANNRLVDGTLAAQSKQQPKLHKWPECLCKRLGLREHKNTENRRGKSQKTVLLNTRCANRQRKTIQHPVRLRIRVDMHFAKILHQTEMQQEVF
jgi:hypothetical protein